MKLFDELHAFVWQSMAANNCNTYLIQGPTRIIVDPGHAAHFDHVKKGLEALGLDVKDIGLVVCTHAHPDHIEAVRFFKEAGALVAIHDKEWQLAKSMEKYLSASLGVNLDAFTPDIFLREGDLTVNGLDFMVYHTPGHSPGSVSLYWPLKKVLFTGDLIFKNGLGRTDLPGGNGAQLKQSIQRLAGLDTEYLLSGHGELITGADEVALNFKQVEQAWFGYV